MALRRVGGMEGEQKSMRRAVNEIGNRKGQPDSRESGKGEKVKGMGEEFNEY